MSPAREVVVLSLEPWSEVWRRNRYIVSELLRAREDLRVMFVEPPRSALRSFPSSFSQDRIREAISGKLWLVSPIEWIPDRWTPILRPVATRSLQPLAEKLGFERPVIWVNNHTAARDAIDTGWPIVYDVTDDWVVVGSSATKRWRARRDDNALLDCAHTVTVCSPSLARRRGRRRPVVTIPNGVDVEQFTRQTKRPADLPPSPSAVYVGTLHEARVDVELCEQIARELPGVAFAFVGPDALSEAGRSRLRRFPNIHLLGARDHAQVAAYYHHANVAIVPHLVSSFTESLDPIKAREILAAGIPTVTTAVAGMRELGPPVRVASAADFAQAVRAALSDERTPHERDNLPSWREVAGRFGEILDRAACFYPRGAETGLPTLPRQRHRLRVGFIVAGELEGTSGIERYSSELLVALSHRDDIDVVPVLKAQDVSRLQTLAPTVDEPVPLPFQSVLMRSLIERYLLGRMLAKRELDLVHGTKHILPRHARVSVITVHDLYVLHRASDYRLSKRILLPAIFRHSLREAHRLIAVSSAVAEALVDRVKPSGPVHVIPEAPPSSLISATATSIPSLAEVPFALCVSDLSARKNARLLVRIWPDIHVRTGLVLALVGPDRNKDPLLSKAIDELVVSHQCVKPGNVTDGELRWCYENAAVVLVPSLEEGFGLPAIEAVALGAPLITSNDPTLIEVTGSHVPHLDPSDTAAWTEHIVSMDTQGALRSQSVLTWEAVAEATVAVYRAAVCDPADTKGAWTCITPTEA